VAGLTATIALAYQDPHLTEDAPLIGGVAGERLPNSARFSGSTSADYVFVASGLAPSVGATLRYVGNRTATFNEDTSNPQYHLPAYTSFDLRSGLQLDSVTLQLFVHNLFNEHGQLSAFTGRGPYAQVATLQPRTIGMSAAIRF